MRCPVSRVSDNQLGRFEFRVQLGSPQHLAEFSLSTEYVTMLNEMSPAEAIVDLMMTRFGQKLH